MCLSIKWSSEDVVGFRIRVVSCCRARGSGPGFARLVVVPLYDEIRKHCAKNMCSKSFIVSETEENRFQLGY